MPLRHFALTAFFALTVAVTACGGGDDGADSVPEVDSVVAAVQARDSQALLDLMGYESVACSSAQVAVDVSPACRSGEEEGAMVNVLRMAQCEGSFLRPGDVPNALAHFLDASPSVYAAFKAPETWEAGEYAVVLSDTQQGGAHASQLVIEGGKIVLLDFGCGETPEEKVADIDPVDFLIDPSEAPTTSEGT
jgi:hypothetical protein